MELQFSFSGWSVKTFSYQAITCDDLQLFCILSCLLPTPFYFLCLCHCSIFVFLVKETILHLEFPGNFTAVVLLSCVKHNSTGKVLIFLLDIFRHQCPKRFTDLLQQPPVHDPALSRVCTRGSLEVSCHFSYSDCLSISRGVVSSTFP